MQRDELARRFLAVRGRSERLMAPLAAEDFRIQSMPDVSPPFWNLGHTSWFFAANVLRPLGREPGGFSGFDYTFNSYYEGIGPRLPRAQRGRVAQPTTAQVREYRAAVDAAMLAWIAACPEPELPALGEVLTIGIEHEQQHQELFVTEILHIRWSAPESLRTAYAPPHGVRAAVAETPLRAVEFAAATTTLGHDQPGFCWDNELPSHRVHTGAFALGDRLITNREWLAFVADGGYRRPLLWLSNGWNAMQQHGWQAPLYWQHGGGQWQRWTLRGLFDVAPELPVCHVSFYEADAFARWYGEQFAAWRHARLPRESEWEHAARVHGFDQRAGNLLDEDQDRCAFDVCAAGAAGPLRQLAGDVWEWTLSHYEPYPGYRPFAGALMEYNGKFMDNQRVLRGGSFATPRSQARRGYRNFWPADTRFQATGVRLLVDR
ncbi:MAG: ergothioneine biosynthesis protein EgtB [Planctomycetes bacterium]|jgi:ergothioneine biosynthesis protein EgtB|nr:ergothioneine biosynthesis protein EgtB [Planctomycetota bacterium]